MDYGKCVLLGESGVGKTSIISNYFKTRYYGATVGSQLFTAKKDDGESYYQIWDTAGQERYRSFANLYYRHAKVAVIICDISDVTTVIAMKYWINVYKEQNPDGEIILLANKKDLANSILSGERQFDEIANELECQRYYTSGKTGYNVNEFMSYLSLLMFTEPIRKNEIILEPSFAEKIKTCCV